MLYLIFFIVVFVLILTAVTIINITDCLYEYNENCEREKKWRKRIEDFLAKEDPSYELLNKFKKQKKPGSR